MFVTCGPLGPWLMLHTISVPSVSSCRPALFNTEMWRNASGEPSTGATKPKPLVTLNHFTRARAWAPMARDGALWWLKGGKGAETLDPAPRAINTFEGSVGCFP